MKTGFRAPTPPLNLPVLDSLAAQIENLQPYAHARLRMLETPRAQGFDRHFVKGNLDHAY
jgi:hypothetical protein